MAELTLPSADVATSASTGSARAKAPAYLNISIPVTGANGETAFVTLPQGAPIDPTGASYHEKTFVNANQKKLMQMLLDAAMKNGGKATFECKAEFAIQVVGVKSEEPATEFTAAITFK